MGSQTSVTPQMNGHAAPLKLIPVPGAALQARINKDGDGSLHTTQAFAAGDELAVIGAGCHTKTPTKYSVQVSETDHIELEPTELKYANHSCAPSTMFNTDKMRVIALKDLEEGDEVTFFYPASEVSMATPFPCKCGASCCLGEIAGASHIDKQVLAKYALNKHVAKLL